LVVKIVELFEEEVILEVAFVEIVEVTFDAWTVGNRRVVFGALKGFNVVLDWYSFFFVDLVSADEPELVSWFSSRHPCTSILLSFGTFPEHRRVGMILTL
jgi:hypothetical protein